MRPLASREPVSRASANGRGGCREHPRWKSSWHQAEKVISEVSNSGERPDLQQLVDHAFVVAHGPIRVNQQGTMTESFRELCHAQHSVAATVLDDDEIRLLEKHGLNPFALC